MPIISDIRYGDIATEDRLDAEYYCPEFVSNLRLIKSIKRIPVFRLGDEEVSRKFKKSVIYGKRTYYYGRTGVPFVRVSDVKNLSIEENNLVFLPKEVPGVSGIAVANPGEILITESGTIGNVGIVPDSYPEWALSGDVICVSLNPNVNPRYVAAFLETKYGKNQLLRGKTQQVQPHLNVRKIKKTLVPLPTSDYQSYIDAIVQEYFKRRGEASKFYKQAEKLLLRQFDIDKLQFPGKNTYDVRFSEIERYERFDAEHYKAEYRQILEILRDSPFKLKKLSDIINVSNETVDPTLTPGEKFTYVQLANVNPSTGEIEETEEIAGYKAPSRARMLLRKGDVLVSYLSGSLDNIALVPEELDNSIGSTGFFVVDSDNFYSEYLFILLRSPLLKKQLEQKTAGTIMTAVSRKDFENLLVPEIPRKQQRPIVNLVRRSISLRSHSRLLIEKAKRDIESFVESEAEINHDKR